LPDNAFTEELIDEGLSENEFTEELFDEELPDSESAN